MHYFAYIRVSTAKQGRTGVSLDEQRDAIQKYAARDCLTISEWFEERETAAKHGRRVFSRMLQLLRQGKANGVIIHKIDRSARNLRDWADLGELIDAGIKVHFANESLDLQSRGGRLSADIQAVVAADYIRNLREETRKGLYGRLKQGFYPMPAPVGYLDRGAGKAKAIDPAKGPLVQRAFELYATGRFPLTALATEMHNRGLANRSGGLIRPTGWSKILNNPFYAGLIRLRSTDQTFAGKHRPLVSARLFNQVQAVLQGKATRGTSVHAFLFRRLLTCARCEYSLVGERQKGHIYYRCHTKGCPTTSIREEVVEDEILGALQPLQFTSQEHAFLAAEMERLQATWRDDTKQQETAQRLRLKRLTAHLHRLTDAYVNGVLDEKIFEDRKTALLMERQEIHDSLTDLGQDHTRVPEAVNEFLELMGSAYLSYKMMDADEKREFLLIVTSNRTIDRKTVRISLNYPFSLIADRASNPHGGAFRKSPRTWARLVKTLWEWVEHNPADAKAFSRFAHQNTRKRQSGKGVGVAA